VGPEQTDRCTPCPAALTVLPLVCASIITQFLFGECILSAGEVHRLLISEVIRKDNFYIASWHRSESFLLAPLRQAQAPEAGLGTRPVTTGTKAPSARAETTRPPPFFSPPVVRPRFAVSACFTERMITTAFYYYTLYGFKSAGVAAGQVLPQKVARR